jgi:translation initiation factor 1 (eIF-1/SUI1)
MRSFQLIDKRTGEVVFDGIEASRRQPCWVCEREHDTPSWCLVDVERRVCICPRVESGKRIGDAGWWHGPESSPGRVIEWKPSDTPAVDFTQTWERCREKVTTVDYVQLAETLGMRPIDFPVWVDLGAYGNSWAFAMHDPHGKVCGIKLRHRDGSKSCVRGSRLGLIKPRTFDASKPEVLVTEGESDALVAASWGFNAVARPGAKSCTTHLETLTRGKAVTLVADRDPAGMDGARLLAADLRKRCKACNIVTPPPGYKDLRDWHGAGGTAEDLAWLLRAARGW